MQSVELSRKMHANVTAMWMVGVALFFVLLTGSMETMLPDQGDQGLALPSPGLWPFSPLWSALINLGLNFLIMVMMVVVNGAFNVMRATSRLPVGLFAIMQAAVPRELLVFNSGTLLALAVITCIYLMFSCWDHPWPVRRVFLVFVILSLGCAVQYCFLVFVPVFLLMCAQMRIFNTRTLLAAFLGCATVWINLLGFGIVDLDDFHLPEVQSIFAAPDLMDVLYMLIVAGLTAALLLTATLLNVVKTIAYNARARAYNGALVLVALVAFAAMVLNYNNVLAYLPLLNMCAAYQLTHYFVNHTFDRQYVAVLSVAGVYVLLYLWRIVI
ncbi:MAG: hypothetical protein K2M19_08420 [Muribaculaceae bacterium]|nr:hypothetical protein [Muribaculaceae bacterium]